MAPQEPGVDVDDLARDVIGAAIEVQKTLGGGLAEALYEEALCIELELMGRPYRRQVPILLQYKGRRLGTGRLDVLVAEQLIVELKCADALDRAHVTQLLTYLKATNCRLGLLLNFGRSLEHKGIRRVVYTPRPNR